MNTDSFFNDAVYKYLWTPLREEVGERWDIDGYPILSLAQDAMNKSYADDEIIRLASRILRE